MQRRSRHCTPNTLKPLTALSMGQRVLLISLSMSRDVAVAVREHLLLFGLLPSPDVALEVLFRHCLSSLWHCFSSFLALLVISRLISCRDEDLFLFGAALASGMPSPDVCTDSYCTLSGSPGSLMWKSSCICSGPWVWGRTFAWIVPSCCDWSPSVGQTLAAYSLKR